MEAAGGGPRGARRREGEEEGRRTCAGTVAGTRGRGRRRYGAGRKCEGLTGLTANCRQLPSIAANCIAKFFLRSEGVVEATGDWSAGRLEFGGG